MLRLSVLGLGAYAAICMSAASASDADIDLRCSSYVGGDGPWTCS
jgi:hypothetical protein